MAHSKASKDAKEQRIKEEYRNSKYYFSYNPIIEYKNDKKPFSIIHDSMLTSHSWKHLNFSDRAIYLTCRNFAQTEYNRNILEKRQEQLIKCGISCDIANTNKRCYFAFPEKVYKKIYDLNNMAVYRSIKNLIEHGFIEIESKGKSKQECNIYKFSTKWVDKDSEYKKKIREQKKARKEKIKKTKETKKNENQK